MARRIANRKPIFAPSQGHESNVRWTSLCDLDRGTILLRDSYSGRRHMDAPPQVEALRHISIMAGLLFPFAGHRSERVAARLIETFGSLKNVVSASADQLSTALDQDADISPLIEGARNLVEASLKERITGTPVVAHDPNLQKYLRLRLKSSFEEQIHVIFLGERFEYLRDECIAKGSAGHVSTHLRHLFKRALDLGAKGFILAHNHPSGIASPSDQDVEATKQIAAIAVALELVLIDHLILTNTETFSMHRGAIL